MSSFRVFKVLGIVLIGLLGVPYVHAGWFDKKPAQEQPKPVPQEQAKPTPAKPAVAQPQKPEPQKVSEITWSDVRSKFIKTDSDLTSAQREKLQRDRKEWWQDYRGKWIRWRGSVKNVSSGGASVKIDMGEGSWTADITLLVAPGSKAKAAELNKDSDVRFVGRMNEQPGGIASMEIQEVTIE